MAKAFSVASWNVQHFGKGSNSIPNKEVGPTIDYLAEQNAEVVGSKVFGDVVEKMPNCQSHITEGPQTQEILIGVKKKFTSFFTQKPEFKSGASALRPGGLLTLTIGNVQINP